MRPYRIGMMMGDKSIDYTHSIRVGVQNTLEDAGHTLVAIADLIPFHSRTNSSAYFRVAFELASRLDLDAIIVPAGSVVGFLTGDGLPITELLKILDRRRTIVIERELAGYRSVAKDNKPGMRECMRHLIERRGLTRIAFIGGPASSLGAREREQVFFEEMAAHGLEVPPSMLAHGELSGECGDEIDRLLDQNPELEAIVCCCDLIAHEVYRVLRRRKLAVGTDIAVTGFDDQPRSAHLDPPLSTVHMTGYDLGCMAAREAVRLCEGLPQQESVLRSTFVVRGSCGDDERDAVDALASLLGERPLPAGRIVDAMVSHTLSMARGPIADDFRAAMDEQLGRAWAAYLRHRDNPDPADLLFSSQDIAALFDRPYRDHLSLDGFQTAALWLLQAFMRLGSAEDATWFVEQISNLHLGIARLLDSELSDGRHATSVREWVTFHITDDAVRASDDPRRAYEGILRELGRLGVRQADVYLLPESVTFLGARSFALSDALLPVGRLRGDEAEVLAGGEPTSLQGLLDHALAGDDAPGSCTVGGIMAGDELLGVGVLGDDSLDADGRLMAFLNLGLALKHLQMIADAREANELLSRSNLVLERESHYDELTGALNRRGFTSGLGRVLGSSTGALGVLMYLDLDGLKAINDTYGHDSGDVAIREAMGVLAGCLGENAVLGRMGGDEFAAFVLVGEAEKDGDARGGDAVLAALGRSIDAAMAAFNEAHDYPFELSISYGGVMVRVDENTADEVTNLMIQADERLYQMKKRRGSQRI